MTTPRITPTTIAAILAGPAVTLAGMAATPWESEKTTAAYQAALAAHPTQGQVAAVLLVFGYALLGLSAFTVLRLARPAAPRVLWGAAAALSFLGFTIMPGIVTSDFYDLALAQKLPVHEATVVGDAAQGFGIALAVQLPALVGFVLGSVLVAVVAAKARLAGAWLPVLVLVGMVGGFAAPVPAAIVGSSSLMLVAYVAMVVRLRRGVETPAPALTPVAVA